MQRLLAVRIVRWPLKLAYIVVAGAVLILLSRLFAAAGVAPVVRASLNGVLGLVVYLYGARVFRGRGEDVARPRPWWRMTAGVRLSTSLGVAFAAAFGSQFLGALLALVNPLRSEQFPQLAVETVCAAAVAYLYVGSSIRLRRLKHPAEPDPEQLPPTTPYVDVPGPTHRVLVRVDGVFQLKSGSALLRASADPATVDVFVQRRRVGSIAGGDLAEPLARTGILLHITLLRTGDLLWAEVPPATALMAVVAS